MSQVTRDAYSETTLVEVNRDHDGAAGPLPFTGFDGLLLLVVAAVLTTVGVIMHRLTRSAI